MDDVKQIIQKAKEVREKNHENVNKELRDRIRYEASDTLKRATGESITVGFSGVPDEVWEALKKDKERRLKLNNNK